MRKKSLEVKKKHHYVWANYLLNWSDNNRDIYYLTESKKIAFDSCKGIAQQKDFYKISALTNDQIEVIRQISRNSPPELQYLHEQLLISFLTQQHLEFVYTSSKVKDEDTELFIKAFKNNAIENLHSNHEDEIKKIISSLKNRDLSILDDVFNLAKFLEFVAQQFTRTKSVKSNYMAQQQHKNGPSDKHKEKLVNDVWWFISYMLGMNIGYSLFCGRENYHFVLLINESEVPFITSDQPVINVKSEFIPDSRLDDALNLFYPLSPTIAFYISRKNYPPPKDIISNSSIIERFNIETQDKKEIIRLLSQEME